MQLLKQSTTTTIQLGPFLDSTDGVTAETGLTVEDTDVYLSKNGGAFANPNDTNDATHDRAGWYTKQLNTTDTNTLGRFIVEVQESGALPVWREFMVVPANVFDSLVGGSDNLEVDAVAISGDTTAADNAELDYDGTGYAKANSTIGTATAVTNQVTADTTAISGDSTAADNAESFFDGTGYAGTNNTIPTVTTVGTTTTNTDMVSEPPTAADNADAVWDEILTGATHNIATSAGRRLRTLQDFGVYEGGAIWIDTVNGVAGTTDYENGTVNNPVDSIADALTLAASVGLSVFHVLPGSSFTLAASVDNYEFRGYGYTVALGAQSLSGTSFENATITGNDDGANGTATGYIRCDMGSNTLGKHTLTGCRLTGDIVLAEAEDYFWDQCYSGVAGTGTPSVDLESAAETKNLSIRHYSGGIEFKNFGAGGGTHTSSVEGFGQVVLNANCAGGTIAIRGNLTVTDNAGGAVTLSDDARIDVNQIGDAVLDEALAGHTTAGSAGKAIADIETDVTAILADTNELQSDDVPGLIGAQNDVSTAEVNAEVVDALNVDTYAEPAGVPAATASIVDKLGWLAVLARNKITQTATTQTLRNDADGADIATSTISDNGTTFTRGEFS